MHHLDLSASFQGAATWIRAASAFWDSQPAGFTCRPSMGFPCEAQRVIRNVNYTSEQSNYLCKGWKGELGVLFVCKSFLVLPETSHPSSPEICLVRGGMCTEKGQLTAQVPPAFCEPHLGRSAPPPSLLSPGESGEVQLASEDWYKLRD